VRVQNNRSTPIYLGDPNAGCGPTPVFALSDASGTPVEQYPGGCGNTCEQLQHQGDYCTGACMMPILVRINPAGSYDSNWAGTVFEARDMPLACYFDQSFTPQTCDQRLVAETGSYTVKVEAYADASCNVGSCDCTPDANGSCEVSSGGQPTGAALGSQAQISFPNDSLVEVVFQ